jgi:small ubiquitin-related modifier
MTQVKKSTKMSKIFDAYAQRRAIARNAFRLLFDGNRIKDDDSPETLQLEATDEIEAVLEQTGGCSGGV